MAKEKKNITVKARQAHWRDVCNEYLETFCKKHEYTYEPDMWVGNDPGTIAMIGDMFVAMHDIRYDIDNDVDEKLFEAWYWKSVDVYELTHINYMNYESFCKGAPDEWTEARMQTIREAQMKIDAAKKEFEDLIEDYKKQGQHF